MRVTFAGVGEAFDETLANTSLLVESEGSSLLLDCGFTAPSAFWSVASRPLDLDGVFISHFHGDHYFGLPALLVRSVEEGRTRRLTILGQPGVEKRVTTLMEMAYANARSKALFPLYFLECVPGQETHLGDFRLNFAMGDHPMPCLAVRLDCGSASLFYSGDGRPTNATRQLATGCGLAVHESFSLDSTTPGHGTVDSSLEFAREAKVAALALVHVKRQVRREMKQTILARTQSADHCRAWLPEPGESITL